MYMKLYQVSLVSLVVLSLSLSYYDTGIYAYLYSAFLCLKMAL